MPVDRRSTLRLLAVAAAILVGALLAFGRAMLPGYEDSWQFDDFRAIVYNSSIQGGMGGWELLSSSSRGVAQLSFAMDHWLWGGLDPRRFRITNLLIHVVNAFLVLALARKISQLSMDGRSAEPVARSDSAGTAPSNWAPRDRGLVLAAALALLWCVHPINASVVVYVVQREEALAAGFCLAALLTWIQGRRDGRPWGPKPSAGWWSFIPWALLTAALLMAGLRSKPVAIVGVVLIPLLELTLLRGSRRSISRRSFMLSLAGFSVGLVAVVYLVVPASVWSFALEGIKTKQSAAVGHYGDWGPWRNLLTQTRVIWSYLSLLVAPLPSRLSVDHHVVVSGGLIQPISTLLSSMGLMALVAASAIGRKSRPVMAFCVLGGVVALGPSSSVVPLKDLMMEYRVYLTSALLMLALMVESDRIVARWPALTPRLLAGIMVVVMLVTIVSWQRCEVFRTRETFWLDAHVKSPLKTRPMFNLGVWYGEHGESERAEQYYQRVVDLEPDEHDARVNLAVILRSRGDVEAAIEHLEQVIRDPSGRHQVEARANIAQALLMRAEKMVGEGDLDQATASVLRAGDEIAIARKQRLQDGRLVKIQESCALARRAMAVNLANAGASAGNKGNLGEAERLLRQALTLDPELEVAQKNLEQLQKLLPRVNPGDR